jgi:hypothetical protein
MKIRKITEKKFHDTLPRGKFADFRLECLSLASLSS